MIKTEEELKKYLKGKHESIFRRFKKLEFETPVHGYWSNKRIGLADMTFRYNQKWYVCEIKYTPMPDVFTPDFWDSLKVVGYAEALSLIYKQKFHPMIMLPKKTFTNDVLTIIGKLDLDYITVYTNKKQELRFDIVTA